MWGRHMRCHACGARVGERDRACFACHRELVPPSAVEPIAEPPVVVALEGSTARSGQVLAAAVPAAPPHRASSSGLPRKQPLVVDLQWGREHRTITIPPEGATLGSTQDADIRVPAGFLAPVHVRFAVRGDDWVVEKVAPTASILHHGESASEAVIVEQDVFRVADRIGNFITLRVGSGARPTFRDGALRSALPNLDESYLIGRDPSCAVTLEHPLVQPRHAALRRDKGGALWIEDRATSAGTYVNGHRLRGRQRLAEGDVVQIGPFSATVGHTALEPLPQVPGIDVRSERATVTVTRKGAAPRTLLNDVLVTLEPASLTAIVGPSGAGKTTLMRMLSGQISPTTGRITYNGVDLTDCRLNYAELTGFVPQDDVVHVDLTVTEALTYQARLRLGTTTTAAERSARVEELTRMLSLTEQRHQLVRTLSGGQRKRVSIACELLKEPQLLFLDEPTSGLDPGLDKRMMLLLRLLADQGRTVLITTHAIAHVDVCDNLILVGPGGHVIYAGPPAAAVDSFQVGTLGDVFSIIDSPEAAAEAAQTARARSQPQGVAAPLGATTPPKPTLGPSFGSLAWRKTVAAHGRIFVGRHARLFARDRSAALITLLQGLVVGLLTALVAPRPLTWSENGNSVVFVVATASVWFGMISAVRELVKERVIWRREHSSGANLHAYIGAKLLVLGALALVQSVTLAAVLSATISLPTSSPVLPPFLAVLLTLWLANLSGVAVGLLVSASSRTADRALSLVPYLLIGQLILCGVLFKLGALTFVSWLVPARWAVSALGGIAGLDSAALQQSSGLYPHSAVGMLGNWLVLAVVTAGCFGLTLWFLRRQAAAWTAGLDEPISLLRRVRTGTRSSA